MRASERADAGEIDAGELFAPLHLMQHPFLGEDAGLDGAPHGDTLDGKRSREAVGDGAGRRIVDADHGSAARAEMGKDRSI